MTRNEQLLLNGQKLDIIGYTTLERLFSGVTPFIINADGTASTDCKKARRYYENHTKQSMKNYEMHHTQDGCIVPVTKELHKSINHIGGVQLFGLKR